MLFHASAVLKNRQDDAFREPKAGERPKIHPTTGASLGFDDAQMRDVRHGDVAMGALDSTFDTDTKAMQAAPGNWVRAVMRREAISSAISKAMGEDGDEFAELEHDQVEVLRDRLAEFSLRMGLAMVGPVLSALENPPKERDAPQLHANGVDRSTAEPAAH